MSVIDPARHADLIALQRAVYAATEQLYAYTGDNAEPMRKQACDAAARKEAALRESGLVQEHGYYVAAQDLKNAVKTAG